MSVITREVTQSPVESQSDGSSRTQHIKHVKNVEFHNFPKAYLSLFHAVHAVSSVSSHPSASKRLKFEQQILSIKLHDFQPKQQQSSLLRTIGMSKIHKSTGPVGLCAWRILWRSGQIHFDPWCFEKKTTCQTTMNRSIDTLQEINISHLGKRKIIFKMPFLGDMLVPWRVYPS